MNLLQLIVLALVQGITEFLPISSSGHLVLTPMAIGEPDQGLLIDAATHVGTLCAVVLYFWRDVAQAILGGVHVVTGRVGTPQAKLALLLVLATIPVMIVGVILVLLDATEALRSVEVIGWATLVWGLVLYAADRWGALSREAEDWSWRDAALMGLAQALALIPGTSRSGITITAARALGFQRVDAAKLAMLMSVPAILAAGTVAGIELAQEDAAVGLDAALAAGLSFVAALASLALLMRMLRGWSLTPFVIYRIILGVVLLGIAYG
jgi:undecaprenyl-diphosphatase